MILLILKTFVATVDSEHKYYVKNSLFLRYITYTTFRDLALHVFVSISVATVGIVPKTFRAQLHYYGY